MSLSTPNSANARKLDQQVIVAVGQYLGAISSLMILGKAYTPTELKAELQAEIDALASLEVKRAAYRAQVLLTNATSTKVRGLRKALRGYILSTYGTAAGEVLAAFGIPIPTQRASKTADTKAKAASKAKDTRKARHTMGKKQRLQITAPPVAEPAPKA